MVRALVFLPGHGDAWRAIDFLIDTGASGTCIHPRDAVGRLRIPIQDLMSGSLWNDTANFSGVGGVAQMRITDAAVSFAHDDGSAEVVTIDTQLAVPTSSNDHLPSLLGWDVLKHFRLEMDYASDAVRLHGNSDETMRVP